MQMKRLNHLVLWSITVVASVVLAGLFIFPASWEGEQHYNCNLGTGVCSFEQEWAYTCTNSNSWIRCTGPQQLNFCEDIVWDWNEIICHPGYTRSESTNWWYYFIDAQFSWNSYCEHPDIFQSISIQGEGNLLTCDYYGNTQVHYNSCREDEGSIFCKAKYVTEMDGGVATLYEDPTAESGYAYCDVIPMVSNFGDRRLDSLCYDPYSESEIHCLYNYDEGEFICPLEFVCQDWPGGEYCFDSRWWEYYCADNEYFYREEESEINNNNRCLSKNGLTWYNNCKYIEDFGYYCPEPQSCELETDWYHCDESGSWEYVCYPNINTNLEATVAEQGGWGNWITFTCGKNWEPPINNCQIAYYGPAEASLNTLYLDSMDSYFFCPVELKYDCDSEDWLAVTCNPSTTGAFSCDLQTIRGNTVNNIQDGEVICGDGEIEYDNCYNEWSKYICPIPQLCELGAWGFYCSQNRSATDYYYCKFKSLFLDSSNYFDSFCERQTGDKTTLPDCYYEGYWNVFCPIKYSCVLQNGMYECSETTENDYFYCVPKYPSSWVAKAVHDGMELAYYCEQPQQGWKRYNDCDYDTTSGKFMCIPKYYDCVAVSWWYQCNVDEEDWEYQCIIPISANLAAGYPQLNYVCSWPNTYNNCTPSGNGYFCPEEESTTVRLDLYMWWCVWGIDMWNTEVINDGGTVNFSLSSTTSTVSCSWEGYLWSVVVNKNSWVNVSTLTTTANLSTPDWKQWVWYLVNEQDATQKITSSTRLNNDANAYVFLEDKPTDKPSWWYSGWGWSSSRPSSKWSWPSSSDVKSVDNPKDNAADDKKEETKPANNGGGKTSTDKVDPQQELFDAYKWAYDNGLTKYANMSDARLDDLLNRQEMAKISTIFATKFHWETPNKNKREDCSQYSDLWKVTSDMEEFIIQSCELGYMWYRANGVDYLERFRPYTPVSIAEVSIILSRIMWKNKYAISETLWYQWHLHAVYENNLLDNITKPFDYITRKDAYLMLYRLSKTLK